MKRTSSLLAAVAGVLISGDAAAQCRTLEFAELNSLDRGALLDMRCEYHDAMFKATIAEVTNAGPSPLRSAAAGAVSNRCYEEITRIDRLIAKRSGLPATNPTALAQRINVMCEARKGALPK